MLIIKTVNLGLRFILELCMLASLGFWGFSIGRGWLLKIGLGLGAPLLAAVAWGIFVAPKASVPLPQPLKMLAGLLIFGVAVAALYACGRPKLAICFAVVIVVNEILMFVWKQ